MVSSDPMRAAVVALVLAIPGIAGAQVWQDRTADCIGTTAEWTNKAEVADVDGDGHVDILLANGGGYNTAGNAEAPRIWRNLGNWTGAAPHCEEITSAVVGAFTGRSRFIKLAKAPAPMILTGGGYQSQLKLFVRDGATWSDASAQLPQQDTSIGDAEFGDVDDDGDLDIVLAEWGTGNPQTNVGGRTRLYLNDGQGTFTDATTTNMPDVLARWSWDIELADVDGDFDLDVLVAVKSGTTSLLFRNDGSGHFTNDPTALPHFSNNYELEPMDIDGDGDLDLVTINDGPNVTEHIFVNNGAGMYVDDTSSWLTGTANPADVDDNVAVWLDADDDGDPDLVIGALGNDPDRLLRNDGPGSSFSLVANATPNDTRGTLGLAIGDLDEDGRIDLVQGQGEIQTALADKVQLATGVAVDTQPPAIWPERMPTTAVVHAMVHDHAGPAHVEGFTKVVVKVGATEVPMAWYGPMLWRATLPLELGIPAAYEVCATDARGNTACVSSVPSGDDAGVGGDGGPSLECDHGECDDGGCCGSTRDARGSIVLALAVLGLSARSRRRPRRSSSAAPDRP